MRYNFLYEESLQATKWQLSSPEELNELKKRANRRARVTLSGEHDNGAAGGEGGPRPPKEISQDVYGFSSSRNIHDGVHGDGDGDGDDRAWTSSVSRGSHPLLSPADESLLVSFYASKIPLLIGPSAALPRCKRDAKVTATATLLFRRFYLSNSVVIHDPKAIMVGAAFLASKVEDAMIDVRYLERGTEEMQAHVPVQDILEAEVKMLKGCDCDLLVFHPYKTVLSYTEDLRTYLKSDRGKRLVSFADTDGSSEDNVNGGGIDGGADDERQVVGEDLRPMHDLARQICDDVIVSEIPLLFGPGEVGLAALMVANDELRQGGQDQQQQDRQQRMPRIDMVGYVRSRFEDSADETGRKIDAAAIDSVTRRVEVLCGMLRALKDGQYGCGNHNVDMIMLKGAHKKLKKCRAWGPPPKPSTKSGEEGEKKKKKKKKQKLEEVSSSEVAAVEGA